MNKMFKRKQHLIEIFRDFINVFTVISVIYYKKSKKMNGNVYTVCHQHILLCELDVVQWCDIDHLTSLILCVDFDRVCYTYFTVTLCIHSQTLRFLGTFKEFKSNGELPITLLLF